MKNAAYLKRNRKLIRMILLMLFVLTIQTACSREQVASRDGLTNCNNGRNPTPIEEDFKFPGDLLFMKSDSSEILAFNGETHELTSIYRTPIDESYGISPLSRDGKTLVISYQKPSKMENLFITILSDHGAPETKSIPLPISAQVGNNVNAWSPVDWANNDYLQGVLYEKENIENDAWESWLLNPYQLEWKSLSTMNNTLDQVERSGFTISPDLTKILYINKHYQIILYDLLQNKILWEYNYEGISPRIKSPNLSNAIWSENGEILALPITRNEGRTPGVLIFDRNGKIVNSIFFGDYQFGYNWSSNGQLLAFYENRSTTIDGTSCLRPVIRIIDMKDGLVRDLCALKEQIDPSQGISNNRIIWSPDQQFLAYSSWSSDETIQDGIILQKLSDPQVRIIQIDTDAMILLGWSKYHWKSANSHP